MELTAFNLSPVRPELAAGMNEPAPAVFKPRRFSDPVSDLNADLHDKARLLAQAVAMADGLGLRILSAEADGARNNRLLVEHCRACDALEGVEIGRYVTFSIWSAHRFGTEIRWVVQHGEAA